MGDGLKSEIRMPKPERMQKLRLMDLEFGGAGLSLREKLLEERAPFRDSMQLSTRVGSSIG